MNKQKVKEKRLIKSRLNGVREWGFFILAVATLFIGISTLTLQIKSTSTILPNLIIKPIDNHVFSRLSLGSIGHTTNEIL
jgi:hypothetical protein